MKSLQALTVAATIVLATSNASAFTGNLVTCTTTFGTASTLTFAPGLTCSDDKQKWTLQATVKGGNEVDGCAANPAAPWDAWAAGGIAKTDATAASTIARADVSLKGTLYGSCNLGGTSEAYRPYAAGKLSLWDNSGLAKVRGGKASFSGFLESEIGTSNALVFTGLVTKGFGVGGVLTFKTSLNVSDPSNNNFTTCNAGSICTDLDPNSPGYDDVFANGTPAIRSVSLITTPDSPPLEQSYLTIDLGE